MSKYKLIIFDLDDVLYHPDIQCCHTDTKEILHLLYKMNYSLAICSHNSNALNIVKKLGIYDYFTTIISNCISESKQPQLHQILDMHPNIRPEEMIFFDDMFEHCQTAKRMGMYAVHIDWRLGITLTNIVLLLI